MVLLAHQFFPVTTPVELETANTASLEQGNQIRWQYDVPEEGVTFDVVVERGRVEFYASTLTTAPSAAFHEWRVVTSSSASVFIRPSVPTRKRSLKTRQAIGVDNSKSTTTPVFVAVFGLESQNDFTLQRGGELNDGLF